MNREVKHIRATPFKTNLSKEDISRNVIEFLVKLREIDMTLFSQWYEKGWTKQEAMKKKIPFEYNFIFNKVEENWDKKFPELGSSINFWNGSVDEEKSSQISFRVGTTSKNININNNLSILFPSFKTLRISEDNLKIIEITKLIEDIWKPIDIKISYFD